MASAPVQPNQQAPFCTGPAFAIGLVGVAGVFGALTAAPKIFFIQTVPAVLALAAHLLGY